MMALRRLAKEAASAQLRRGGGVGGGFVSPPFAPPRAFSAASGAGAPPAANPSLVGRHGLQRIASRCSSPAFQAGAPKLGAFLAGRVLRGVHPQLAGRKLLKGLGTGSTLAAAFCSQRKIADCEEEQSWEQRVYIARPSAKYQISDLWHLVKKYQLLVGLIVLIALRWRNPLGLFINTLLLLYSSSPSPYTIYLFLQEIRHGKVDQSYKFWGDEVIHTRKVEAKDYKFFSIGTIELEDREVLHVIGILGIWWIYRASNGKSEELA